LRVFEKFLFTNIYLRISVFSKQILSIFNTFLDIYASLRFGMMYREYLPASSNVETMISFYFESIACMIFLAARFSKNLFGLFSSATLL